MNVQDIVGREKRGLGANGTAILELAHTEGTITRKDVAKLLGTSPASAKMYLGRLTKSRDLTSDRPGQFSITEIRRVAVLLCCVVARQRNRATRQRNPTISRRQKNYGGSLVGRRPEPIPNKIGGGTCRPDCDKLMTVALADETPPMPDGPCGAGR